MTINILVLNGELNGKIVVVRFFFCWVYKYGCNHSLDNKVMSLYSKVSQRMPSTSQIILLSFLRGVVKSFDSTLFSISLNGNKYCHLFFH